jgi:hypothetical protein
MRTVLAFVLVLAASAALGQTSLPDQTLTTVDSDSSYALPGDVGVSFDLRNMPNAVKLVTSTGKVDIGQAYRVEAYADGTYELSFYENTGTIGSESERAANVTLDGATKVTLLLWVRE